MLSEEVGLQGSFARCVSALKREGVSSEGSNLIRMQSATPCPLCAPPPWTQCLHDKQSLAARKKTVPQGLLWQSLSSLNNTTLLKYPFVHHKQKGKQSNKLTMALLLHSAIHQQRIIMLESQGGSEVVNGERARRGGGGGRTRQLIIDRRGGCVAVSVQGLLRGLGLLGGQLQLLFNLLNDAPPASVYTEVLKGLLKVWDVCLHLHLQDLQSTTCFGVVLLERIYWTHLGHHCAEQAPCTDGAATRLG